MLTSVLVSLLGYLGAAGVGLVLGLIGAGGSILCVPIFVYCFGIAPLTATVYSLFVVGLSALTGAAGYYRQGFLNLRVGTFFLVPAFAGIFAARRFLVPSLPEVILRIGGFTLTREGLVLVVFAGVMVAAALSMLRSGPVSPRAGRNYGLVAVQGLFVGTLTGFVGAGGGFLIVPGLVILVGLPMKEAVGTSLGIITANSLFGFAVGAAALERIDWLPLLVFLGFAVAGNLLGMYLGRFVSGARLKSGFGWFVLGMGIYILIRELTPWGG